ncbi:hypothetical protein [Marinobacterium rhizophilum]|uniref:Uncharacterized protein n=1 Tax=Marinobacterium rhizophilum TaxID=420402 RepID=A0ABY5HP08_9GAMM|nr:hypothetical protein [Marinobacterium rhizophilum]UTW12979.1 hypothetical protein KDW95_04715 [Marinobacterium rhizophilum]
MPGQNLDLLALNQAVISRFPMFMPVVLKTMADFMRNAVRVVMAQYLYVTDPIAAVGKTLGVGALFDFVDQTDMDENLITLRHRRRTAAGHKYAAKQQQAK